jgi:hypothetical protein
MAASIRSLLYSAIVERRGSESAIVRNLNEVRDDSGRGICLSEHGYGQQAEMAMISLFLTVSTFR